MILTLEYLKARERMCKTVGNCSECGLYDDGMCELETTNPLQAIEIVEKWAKENPVKTYKNVILEKLPNIDSYENGTPTICLGKLFSIDYNNVCKGDCEKCWNQEYTQQEGNNG